MQKTHRKALLQAPLQEFFVPILTASARHGQRVGAVYITFATMTTSSTLTGADFKLEGDPQTGKSTGNWFSACHKDPEVLVRDEQDTPRQQDIDRANAVLVNVEHLKSRATKLLEGFMKDKGTWHLATIDCGIKAERLEVDFVLSFDFEADRDPYEYGYTYFDVGFIVPEISSPIDRLGRPTKFVVGFH